MAKSANAFRTISEAATEVGAPQHVLRFWETKFPFVTPVKRAGGRRFYRPQDVIILKAIRRLLHDEGLTIKGVQRLHKEQGLVRIAAYGGADATFSMDADLVEQHPEPGDTTPDTVEMAGLRDVLARIEGAKARLDVVLAG
ncbi:MerR family transcriptional regulator [Brevundimonas variabilis]|uniref:DNA-binding transcriptional MerR regulator n=1 Tax=Brevundimonas variabilis TaxID=74312 RepID=A0A7W9FFL2_9CAUL|nr:DNA-binding transcriptional MerR regulator [Brevundimonas variabilis]